VEVSSAAMMPGPEVFGTVEEPRPTEVAGSYSGAEQFLREPLACSLDAIVAGMRIWVRRARNIADSFRGRLPSGSRYGDPLPIRSGRARQETVRSHRVPLAGDVQRRDDTVNSWVPSVDI
jgi:hypothetical protein